MDSSVGESPHRSARTALSACEVHELERRAPEPQPSPSSPSANPDHASGAVQILLAQIHHFSTPCACIQQDRQDRGIPCWTTRSGSRLEQELDFRRRERV